MPKAASLKPLWTCPACGERFVTQRLWHSCGRHTYDALFAKSEPHVRKIFEKLAAIAGTCGPVRIYPQKTRVVFQVRTRFANGSPRKRAFIAGFMMPLGVQSSRFVDVLDGFSRHYKMGWVKLETEKDVDAEIARWMKRAYKFGAQEHLR